MANVKLRLREQFSSRDEGERRRLVGEALLAYFRWLCGTGGDRP